MTAVIWRLEYSFLHITGNFFVYKTYQFLQSIMIYFRITDSQVVFSKICRNVVYKL